MVVAILLGNRMKDDGTISDIMKERLQTFLKLLSSRQIDKIIVSGGVANKKAGKAEADAMFSSLVASGVAADKIIKEDKSKTTTQNAMFSVPIALSAGATEIVVCSSKKHIYRWWLSPIRDFKKQVGERAKLTFVTEEDF